MWVGSLQHPDPSSHIAELAAAPARAAAGARRGDQPVGPRAPGVILTGEVDDGELAALYSGRARARRLP